MRPHECKLLIMCEDLQITNRLLYQLSYVGFMQCLCGRASDFRGFRVLPIPCLKPFTNRLRLLPFLVASSLLAARLGILAECDACASQPRRRDPG